MTTTITQRGIANINGTSCHTSSAIQLIYHCFPKLRSSILELAPKSAEYHVVTSCTNNRQKKNRQQRKNEGGDDKVVKNDKEEEEEVIDSEFIYQLSWFFHLLAYNEDIIDISRVKHQQQQLAEKKEAGGALATNDIDNEETMAVAASIGIATTNPKEQQISSEEFHSILNEAASTSKKKAVVVPGSPNSRKSRRRNKHHRKNKKKSNKDHPSSPGSRASSRRSTSNKRHLKKTSEINTLQRQAIATFMSKARSGQSTTNDWKYLVQIMKGNNRQMYDEALGRKLDEHTGIREEDDDAVGKKKKEEGEDMNERNASDKTTKVGNTKKKSSIFKEEKEVEEEDSSTPLLSPTSIGNQGGGKGSSDLLLDQEEASSAADAVDPTSFYQHVNTYTSNLSTSSSSKHTNLSNVHINTSNVGDAAHVFRCLISALEYSTQEEMARLQGILDVREIESWNDEGKEEEVEVEMNNNEQGGEKEDSSEKQLILLLQAVQTAIQYYFMGTLISRIVGTSISITTNQDNNPMVPPASSVGVETTITKVQRTKKTDSGGPGGIRRTLPVPLVLPVIKADEAPPPPPKKKDKKKKRQAQSKEEDEDDDETNKSTTVETTTNNKPREEKKKYYPSIIDSLYSVTIHPNPIRGYDWRGLIKRDEVIEETFVKVVDGDGNEIKVDEILSDNDETKKRGEGDEVEDVEVIKTMSEEGDNGDAAAVVVKEAAEEEEDVEDENFNDDDDDVFLSDVESVIENEKNEARSVSSTEFHHVFQRSTSQGSISSSPAAIGGTRKRLSSVGGVAIDNTDDISVLSHRSMLSTASRSIACQTDFDENGNPIHGVHLKTIEVRTRKDSESKIDVTKEEEKKEDVLEDSQRSADVIEKDACYAAAVAAIVSARGKSTSVASRHRSRAAAREASSVDVRRKNDYKPGSPRSPVERQSRALTRSASADGGTSPTTAQAVRGTSMGSRTSIGSRGGYQGRSVEKYNRIRERSVDSRRSLRGTSIERRSSRYRSDTTSMDSRKNSHIRSRSSSVGRRMVEATTKNVVPAVDSTTPKEDGPKTMSYEPSPSLFAPMPGVTTPSGMEIGPGSATNTSSTGPRQMSYMNSMTLAPQGSDDDVMLPLDSDDSSSDDESSIDSQVSSVDTDTTSEDGNIKQTPGGVGKKEHDDHSFSTHSSDIDTPENIDDLSLGSFTDESQISDVEVNLLVEEEEDLKKQDSDIELNNDVSAPPQALEDVKPPAVLNEQEDTDIVEDKKDPKEGMSIAPSVGSTSYSAVSDSNSDDSSSGSSSSDDDDSSTSSDSSTPSDDTSSTETDSDSSSDSSEDDGEGTTPTSSSIEKHDRDLSNAVAAAAMLSNDNDDDESSTKSNDSAASYLQNNNEWVTRKETRLCHPLPQSLIFHLKRFDYSTASGRVEKLSGEVDIPLELDLKACSLDVQKDVQNNLAVGSYRYSLAGAIVHVDPIENEDEVTYGEPSEGHYVTFICHSAPTTGSEDSNNDTPRETQTKKIWTEIDDEFVRSVDSETALKVISGCEISNDVEEKQGDESFNKKATKKKERRYATLVVYSRD